MPKKRFLAHYHISLNFTPTRDAERVEFCTSHYKRNACLEPIQKVTRFQKSPHVEGGSTFRIPSVFAFKPPDFAAFRSPSSTTCLIQHHSSVRSKSLVALKASRAIALHMPSKCPTVRECLQRVWYRDEWENIRNQSFVSEKSLSETIDRSLSVSIEESLIKQYRKNHFTPGDALGQVLNMTRSGAPKIFFSEQNTAADSDSRTEAFVKFITKEQQQQPYCPRKKRKTKLKQPEVYVDKSLKRVTFNPEICHFKPEELKSETGDVKEKWQSLNFMQCERPRIILSPRKKQPPKPIQIIDDYYLDRSLTVEYLQKILETTAAKDPDIYRYRETKRPKHRFPTLKGVIQVAGESRDVKTAKTALDFHAFKDHDKCICT